MAELARDESPARVVDGSVAGCFIRSSDAAVAELGEPIERDLHVRRRQVLGDPLRLAIRAACGAGERVAVAQRVEDLAADAARGIRAERGAQLAPVPLCGLDQPDHTPGDEVLAIGATAPRIEGACRHGPREAEVRHDALASRRPLRVHAANLGTVRKGVNSELTQISTEAAAFFDRYAYPDYLRTHSLLVGRIAETILAARAAPLPESHDIALAAYLHDIGRSPLVAGDRREHNELSALILAAEGLAGAVEPARRHAIYTVLETATSPATIADKIVYVADRRGGMRVEPIEERARDTAQRYPRYATEIDRALPAAKALEREVFQDLPFTPGDLEGHLIT